MNIGRNNRINRLPRYFKQELPDRAIFEQLKLFEDLNIHTVCVSAHCPNLTPCFKKGTATFMILGDTCSRNCNFCAVKKSRTESLGLDIDEPYRIASLAKRMDLRYVVLTSVSRDDLADGGASQFVRTIDELRNLINDVKIEVLIPDLLGNIKALKNIVDVAVDVMAHNLETVPRLYKDIRPKAKYNRSLDILKAIKVLNLNIITKTSLLLGMGEREDEVISVMRDLLRVSCDVLTLGQYLSPSLKHYPVKEFISLERFNTYREIALCLGFKAVLSGPLVRSSYKAEELYYSLRDGSCQKKYVLL